MAIYRQGDIELAVDTLRSYDIRNNPRDCNRSGSIFIEEWAYLYRFIRSNKIRSMVEIGSWYHVSSLAFLTALSHNGGGSLISVDLNFPLDLEFRNGNVKWTKIKGSSFNIIKTLDDTELVFVDGAHGSSAVEIDCRNSLSILKSGGYLIVHDINYNPTIEGIKKVIDINDCFCWSSQPDGFHGVLVYQKK